MTETDSPRAVQITPGTLGKTRGLMIETSTGRAFIPGDCLPEIRRQLARIQDHYAKGA